MSLFRPSHSLAHRCLLLISIPIGSAMHVDFASAQATTLTIDPIRSSAWWQIDPHFGHLWATTCPRDPSWQPGEGHGPGYYINYAARPKIKTTNAHETRLPLFPRKTVRPVCRNALKGSITTSDITKYTDIKGEVILDPDSIATGADARDIFSRKYVFSSNKYPTIRFGIDSVTSITMSGDTANGIAVGVFELRGVRRPMRVAVNATKDPNGLRIRGVFGMPAHDLRDIYGVSQFAMGAGVGLNLWDNLFIGFDLIMKPEGTGSGAGGG